MVASPIRGGSGVGRSINAVDAQCINLFLEIIDTKDGAAPGYLQMAPGLDLLVTLGPGPIRGPKIHSLNGIAYVVSGPQLWALFPNLSSVLLGTLGTSAGNVSVIDNGSQVAIFDGYAGYLTSTSTVNSGGGVPLTGGTIGAGSAGFAVGDTINLGAVMGTQDATAVLTVTAETAGVVTSFTVMAPGLFSVAPTSLSMVLGMPTKGMSPCCVSRCRMAMLPSPPMPIRASMPSRRMPSMISSERSSLLLSGIG